jgi:hypothetical protein
LARSTGLFVVFAFVASLAVIPVAAPLAAGEPVVQARDEVMAAARARVDLRTRPKTTVASVKRPNRDPLGHHWPLDKTTADVAGSQDVTLGQGATFAPGRVGGAVQFDGTTGAATTSAVDVRTDQSFTVSAWVNLSDTSCDLSSQNPECKRVAVSADGGRTSKFRLGHIVDRDHAFEGVWFFEMPESDADNALITKAAVTALPADIDTWVHLAGVYDAQAKMITIYMDGNRRGEGTVNNTWLPSKGMAIGRGKVNGAASQFWPGMVDDVRMYTGLLTGDQIWDLYTSYPS